MSALQDLGAELAGLSSAQLIRLGLPENLQQALLSYQQITTHGARRRQMQYVGKLMRQVDVVPIQAQLAEIKGLSQAAIARQHSLEQWRERVLADAGAIDEWLKRYPTATAQDVQRLRQLRRNAQKERELGKPPRSFREIFQLLRQIDRAATTKEPHAE